jgi:hypothetical protein
VVQLEFLPANSSEVQPAVRLWALANEAVANRFLQSLAELEGALVEHCVALLADRGTIRSYTNFHQWSDTTWRC